MTGETIPLAPAQEKSQASFMRRHLRDYSLLMCLLVILVFFQFMTDGKLFDPLNITNIILRALHNPQPYDSII